jgi:molybdate transport system substrate-binding protein
MAKRILSSLLLCCGLVLGAAAQEKALVVSAAASLTDVLNGLKPAAEAAVGMPIQFNYGGSGALRKQIEQGAPVDLFFSAAAEDVDKLEAAGLLAPGSRLDLLSNAIVLVGDSSQKPVAGVEELKPLLSGAKVFAIGNPDSVPAGRYASQALKSLGLYPLVEGKLVLGGNVREVLQYVQSGSAPLGVVFLTDAMSVKAGSPIAVLYRFPASSLPSPVLYPVAIVAASKNQAAAAKLITFFKGEKAQAAFTAAGFVTTH